MGGKNERGDNHGKSLKETVSVYCRDCPRYDTENSRCKDGKVNPPKWEMAITTAQVLGLRAICTFNPHRERLIQSRRPF